MNQYVALLRGINVGGKNPIKMDVLRACLTDGGFHNVSTYIASGNVLFTSEDDRATVERRFDAAVDTAFGYKGPTVILSRRDYQTVMKEAPAGFGSEPETFDSDVVFVKLPADPAVILKDIISLRLREGVDTAAAGSKALYFTRLSAERTKSRMSKITELDDYKRITIRSWTTASKLERLLRTDA